MMSNNSQNDQIMRIQQVPEYKYLQQNNQYFIKNKDEVKIYNFDGYIIFEGKNFFGKNKDAHSDTIYAKISYNLDLLRRGNIYLQFSEINDNDTLYNKKIIKIDATEEDDDNYIIYKY